MAAVRILHLEDSLDDAEIIRTILERGGLPSAITLVMSRAEFEAAVMNGRFDLILCDYKLPGYDGFAALAFVKRRQPDIPIIMLSGVLDDAHAVQSLKNGATDYVFKGKQARLIPAIRRALAEAHERRRRTAAEAIIREQASLLNLIRDAVLIRTMTDKITFWNAGAATLFGWSSKQAIGQEFGQLLHVDHTLLENASRSLLQSGDWMGEIHLKGKEGGEIIVLSHWNLLRDKAGQPRAILSINTDITERKKLEAVLLRAQRMDSIGALAGGIVHDLSNALAPILVSAELLEDCPDQAVRRKIEVIRSNAQRARLMVRQILGFVRGRSNGHGLIAMSELLSEMETMVRTTFPKSIKISATPIDTELWKVEGDSTELHQVILNLCVNARDAMPHGGQLSLSVQNLNLDPFAAAAVHCQPGPHVVVSVADTGTGIPPNVLPRIFEPFYTTKHPDKGTGLGLPTAAGIVQRLGGSIEVKTELGKGTEFKIYLPATEHSATVEIPDEIESLPVGHGEMILIIEDEEALLELTKETLENYGYQVVTAQSGAQGIARFEELRENIKLVLADTDMTQMSGLATARVLRERRSDLPVIIASGSHHGPEELALIEAEHLRRLEKPFSLEQLLVTVAQTLHS